MKESFVRFSYKRLNARRNLYGIQDENYKQTNNSFTKRTILLRI